MPIGIYKRNTDNMLNKKFNKLTVIGLSKKRTKCGLKYWKCRCDCGKIIETIGTNLRINRKKSCGCLHHLKGKLHPSFKHGLSRTRNYRLLNHKKYIMKKYNSNLQEYFNLLNTQNNKCAICGINQNKLTKNLSIDHNHKTGNVRGLLCTNCNSMLGLSKENYKILINAIKYLRRYR